MSASTGPPAGVSAFGDGPPDSTYQGHGALVFTGIFLIIQVTFVALRYLSKWQVNVKWGWDDILVLITLFLQISMAGIAFDALINGGVGYHLSYVMAHFPGRFTHWLKGLYALTFIYNFAATLPKLAILIFYERVFGRSSAHWHIRILFAILCFYAVLLTALDIGSCWPVAANWHPRIPGARCLNQRTIAAWIALPNIITDVWMLFLPIPVIWNLQASRSLKIGLTFTFLIGGIGLAASIGRFVENLATKDNDATWEATTLLIWIQVEPGCYLISACLPTLRPLLDKIANRFITWFPESIKRTFGSKASGSRSNRSHESTQWNMRLSFTPQSASTSSNKTTRKTGGIIPPVPEIPLSSSSRRFNRLWSLDEEQGLGRPTLADRKVTTFSSSEELDGMSYSKGDKGGPSTSVKKGRVSEDLPLYQERRDWHEP